MCEVEFVVTVEYVAFAGLKDVVIVELVEIVVAVVASKWVKLEI